MIKEVTVCDRKGQVVIVSKKNPEYGHILLKQQRVKISKSNYAEKKTLTAQLSGRTEELQSFNWKVGQKLPGRIVIIEQLTPFSNKNPDQDLKYAGKNGVVCKFNGQNIYRKVVYREDPNAVDQLIAHDNNSEIAASYNQKSDSVSSF